MSGGIMAAAVEFPAFFVEFDHVRCASRGLFLVRNWCGSFAIETWTRALRSVGANVRTQVSPGDRQQANTVCHRAG
jgi:hypothetical protein